MHTSTALRSYERLDGEVPVVYAPAAEGRAVELERLLATGIKALSGMLDARPPELEALLVADEDREEAPRETARAYPPGLPYYTRSVRPPVLVLPVVLSCVFEPRTEATYPLVVWHELAHAFLLRNAMVRTPAWLRELVPQGASAAVARRAGLPLDEHLRRIERVPGPTVRSFGGHVDASRQMEFQNLLLLFGAAALEEFGEGFLRRLVHALWSETDIVDEERAEEMLAAALGSGGGAWLKSRPEF